MPATKPTTPHSVRGAYLLLLLPPLLWAGNVVLARAVRMDLPPISLSFFRWLTALLLLLPFVHQHVRRDWRTALQGWKTLLAVSLLGIASFNTLLYTAVRTTTAINCALMQTIMPAVIILLCYLLFREKISPLQGGGVILCLFGSALIVARGDLQLLSRLDFVSGDLLMLLAVVCYALYSVLLRFRPPIHPMSFLAITFALGTLMLLPLYLWERFTSGPLPLTPTVFGAVAYIALGPSIVAYLCWNRGIAEVGASRAGLYINLIPLFASLMAVAWLNESFAWYHTVGLICMLGGLLIFNRTHWLPWLRTYRERRAG